MPAAWPACTKHRRFEDALAGGDAHHVAINEPEIARISLGDVERITPDLFGERLGTFLQPGIVGDAAVEHRRIGRERKDKAGAGGARARSAAICGAGRDCFARGGVGDDAVLQRLPPPVLEIFGRAGYASATARARYRRRMRSAAPPQQGEQIMGAVRVS